MPLWLCNSNIGDACATVSEDEKFLVDWPSFRLSI